jgi:hypothetical protein
VSDSNQVDAALIDVLADDPTLAGLLPDGVFVDVASAKAQRFVIVQLLSHEDTDGFTTAAFERFVYLVKAVVLSTSGADIKGASLRIHELLQRVPMAIVGYSHMSTVRTERVRYTEVDSVESDIRWQHRGGHYEIFVSPNP